MGVLVSKTPILFKKLINNMNHSYEKELGNILSFFGRMNEQKHYFDAMDDKNKLINEIMSKLVQRKQITRDEIFDVIEHEQLKGGVIMSITYVNGKSPIKQKVWRGNVNWDSEKMSTALNAHQDMSDANWHKQLSDFNREDTKLKKNPVSNIVVMQTYLLNLTTNNSYGRTYSDYVNKLSNLRLKFGIGTESNGVLGDNHNQRQKVDGGGQFNQTGKLSKDFNMVGSKKYETKVFLIDENGEKEAEIPEDVFKAMMKYSDGIEKEVKEKLTPEQLEQYVAEKKELSKAFRAQTFNYDGILSIVCKLKDGGDYFYYINDKLAPTKVFVNSETFKQMAEESLGASCEAIQGFESESKYENDNN